MAAKFRFVNRSIGRNRRVGVDVGEQSVENAEDLFVSNC